MIYKKLSKFIPVLACIAVPLALPAAPKKLPTFLRQEPPKTVTQAPVPNCGFEGSGGWYSITGGAPAYSNDSYTGNRSASLNAESPFIKTDLIPLAPGEDLQFTLWAKTAKDLVTITAEMAFFDANRNWLRRGSGPIARSEQYVWNQMTGHFFNSDPEVRYVALQFYGAGVIDDVDIKIVKMEEDDTDYYAASEDIPLPEETTDDMVYLANENYGAWISKETGMMTKFVSYSPTYKVIQPAGVNSMQLYLKSEAAGIDGDFDIVLNGEFRDDNTLVCLLTSSDPATAAMADAEVVYTLDGEKFTVDGKIIFKADDDNQYQCGMRNVFRPDDWQRNICLTYPVSAKTPDIHFRSISFYDTNDTTVQTMYQNYPFVILEGDDRWMVWGDFEIGKFVMLTPNDIAWRLPSQQKNPASVKKGMVQSFNSNYIILPKYNNDLPQVMHTALNHVHSDHHLLKGLIKRPDLTGRYCTPGAFAWYHPGSVPLGEDGWRQEMLDRHANNVWYSWWSTWQETNEIEGDWYTYDCRHLSAEGNKKEIAYMNDMGLNVYLYFRQFLVEDGTYEDKAPYKEWLGRSPEGKRQPFIDHKVQNPAVLGGLEYVRWTCADFGNKDFREWYLDKTKKAIAYYEPKGVAWDMGYGSLYSRSEPETGAGVATFWVQVQIYNWLKENYPHIRIATNESVTSPTALFGDSILIEGAWDVVKKSELDYLIAKGYGTTVFSLQLADDYSIQGAPLVDMNNYSAMKIKARGKNLANAYFAAADLMKNGFKDDGSWQELEIPVSGKFRIYGVVVRANDNPNAYLEVANAELIGKNGVHNYTLLNSDTKVRDYVSFGKWNHNFPTTGDITKTADGIKFAADQARGNKTWSCFTPIMPRLIQINLKVLGLGAICSDTQINALKDLNEFSAELAAMHHISAKKLIYNAPDNVYGTFWHREGRTAGCIYNDSAADCQLALQLDRSAMPDNGDSLLQDGLNIRVADTDAVLSTGSDFTISGDETAIYINGTLPAGNLLVISNW